MPANDISAATEAGPRKSTGSLKAPTGSLEAPSGAMAEPEPGRSQPARRDFTTRLAELVIFLAAILGAVALGLGISEYFSQRPYAAAYLIAYAAFRFADLLVRDETALGIDPARFARRMMSELPVLAIFFGAPFERTYLYGGDAPRWLCALGLLIELGGLWLALGARIQLGFFSPPRGTGTRRPLVRNGFYGYIRHPIYLGEFLVLLAWPFEYGAPVTLAIVAVSGILVTRRRILDEEAEMLALFGDEYAGYIRETDAVIPNVW
jgi:protein-S-isoprenylcysteine O-methyltransferase Ste14